MRNFLTAIGAALAAALVAGPAMAQAPGQAPKIWDIKLGTPDQGPAGRLRRHRLRHQWRAACAGAQELRRIRPMCPVEPTTGLHEVWFRYDDEMEYVARARRSEIMVRQYQANALAGQPIITSLLIDDAGLVEGYRVVNDPRADAETRSNAYGLADLFKGMAWTGLECNDLPPATGERPIDDLFVKEVCENKSAGLVTRVEARRYYKPGQFAVDPNDNRLTENLFESSARLEVYRPPAGAPAPTPSK